MTVQEHIREVRLGARMLTQRLRPTPERVGWLVGSGRSGTTWLASLINADATMREVFEPVHALHVPHMAGGPEHPYLRPGQPIDPWTSWQANVFDGRHITRRTDRDNVGRNPANARSLLVKDVFACGMVAAVLEAHPHVAPALVMRHPVAVALSKQAHRDWLWTWTPGAFLSQPELVEDHLGPWVDSLARMDREGSEMAKLVAVWAVLQRVALRSAPANRMPILHYETAVLDPWRAMQALREHPAWEGMITAGEPEVEAAAQRVSFVSKSAQPQALPNPTRWTTKVDGAAVHECNVVLRELGMEGWHDDKGLPVPEVIQAWRDAQTPPRA